MVDGMVNVNFAGQLNRKAFDTALFRRYFISPSPKTLLRR